MVGLLLRMLAVFALISMGGCKTHSSPKVGADSQLQCDAALEKLIADTKSPALVEGSQLKVANVKVSPKAYSNFQTNLTIEITKKADSSAADYAEYVICNQKGVCICNNGGSSGSPALCNGESNNRSVTLFEELSVGPEFYGTLKYKARLCVRPDAKKGSQACGEWTSDGTFNQVQNLNANSIGDATAWKQNAKNEISVKVETLKSSVNDWLKSSKSQEASDPALFAVLARVSDDTDNIKAAVSIPGYTDLLGSVLRTSNKCSMNSLNSQGGLELAGETVRSSDRAAAQAPEERLPLARATGVSPATKAVDTVQPGSSLRTTGELVSEEIRKKFAGQASAVDVVENKSGVIIGYVDPEDRAKLFSARIESGPEGRSSVSFEPMTNLDTVESRYFPATNREFANLKTAMGDIPPQVTPKAPNGKSVLVVGGGPVGLLNSLRFYEEGYAVTMVEARSDYIRNQVLIVEPEQLASLRRFIGEKAYNSLKSKQFIPDLGQGKAAIKISDLERALAVASETHSRVSNGKFKVLYGHEFSSIATTIESTGAKAKHFLVTDASTGRAYQATPDIIVGSDSARSAVGIATEIPVLKTTTKPVYTVVVAFNNDKMKIGQDVTDYTSAEGRRRYPANGPKRTVFEAISTGANFAPQGRLQNTLATKSGFYWMEELTEAEYKEYSSQGVSKRDWAISRAKAAFKSYGVTESLVDILVPFERPTDAAAFPVELQRPETYAKTVTVGGPEGKTVQVFLNGDAAHTTHFLTGSGFNQGARDVETLISTLQSTELAKAASIYDTVQQTKIHDYQAHVMEAVQENTKMGVLEADVNPKGHLATTVSTLLIPRAPTITEASEFRPRFGETLVEVKPKPVKVLFLSDTDGTSSNKMANLLVDTEAAISRLQDQVSCYEDRVTKFLNKAIDSIEQSDCDDDFQPPT